MLKGSSGKDGQYAWTDGKFQQRESTKVSNANVVHKKQYQRWISLMGVLLGHSWEKNSWTWRYVNRNYSNWNIKIKRSELNRTALSRVVEHETVRHLCN